MSTTAMIVTTFLSIMGSEPFLSVGSGEAYDSGYIWGCPLSSGHNESDSAFTGIERSASSAKSSSGERPRVVR